MTREPDLLKDCHAFLMALREWQPLAASALRHEVDALLIRFASPAAAPAAERCPTAEEAERYEYLDATQPVCPKCLRRHGKVTKPAAPAAEPERQTCVPCQGTGRKQGGGGWGLCPDCNGHGFVTAAPPSEPVAPAGGAQPPDPEGDRNRHNAMLVEAWREEFATLCKVLFPGDNGPIGWKHVQAKVKALADGGEGKT